MGLSNDVLPSALRKHHLLSTAALHWSDPVPEQHSLLPAQLIPLLGVCLRGGPTGYQLRWRRFGFSSRSQPVDVPQFRVLPLLHGELLRLGLAAASRRAGVRAIAASQRSRRAR